MDIVFVDDKCYRYVYYCLIWFVVGKVDLLVFVRFYMYLDLFFIGEQLLKQIILFEKVKLINNMIDQNGYVSKRGFYLYFEIFIMDIVRCLE